MVAGATAAYMPGGWMMVLFGALMGLAQYALVGVLIVLFSNTPGGETHETSGLPLVTKDSVRVRVADFFRLALLMATLPIPQLITLPMDECIAAPSTAEKAFLFSAILLAAFLALCALPVATWEVCTLMWSSIDYH